MCRECKINKEELRKINDRLMHFGMRVKWKDTEPRLYDGHAICGWCGHQLPKVFTRILKKSKA